MGDKLTQNKNVQKNKQILKIIVLILLLIFIIVFAGIYLKKSNDFKGFFCAISSVLIIQITKQLKNKMNDKSKYRRKMKVILDKNQYNDIWNKVYEKFKFQPSIDINVKPFEFDVDYKVYKLMFVWNEEQEKIVNNIFKEMSNKDIYALNWNHDCFEFNPKSEIPLDYHYHDNNRNCEVYFPSYYPNGDYYFFISKDFSYGLLGHPWRKEIYVFGDKLIDKFEKHIDELELVKGIDENKTLLELCDIPDIKTNFESYVVKTSESAIRKPLKDLSTEEIRLLIEQRIGLKYLIPMALHILNRNNFIGVNYYNGDLKRNFYDMDLLNTILRLNEDDWKNNDINININIFDKTQIYLEKNVDKNIVINNLNDIFNKLKKEYKVEWVSETKDAFYVYFSGDKKQYKIYVDNSYIGIYQKNKFLKFEEWSDLTHEHCDNDDTFLDIYKVVMYYIKKYKKEKIKREYQVIDVLDRETLVVSYTNVENGDVLSGFVNFDVSMFESFFKEFFENILFSEKTNDSTCGNLYYIESDKETTKIGEQYPEFEGAPGREFEGNTQEVYELILEYCNKKHKFYQKNK